MSALVLRHSANILHCAKRYACNGSAAVNVNHAGWTGLGRRAFAADATSATGKKEQTSSVKQTNADTELLDKLKAKFDGDVQAGKVVPVFKRALHYGDRVAIKDENGEYSYHQIYSGAKELAAEISQLCGTKSEANVAFLCPNTAEYSLVQWACWVSGQVAVPLSSRYPPNLIEYYLKDSDAQIIITVPEFAPLLEPIAKSLKIPIKIVNRELIPAADNSNPFAANKQQEILQEIPDASFYAKSNALILYTSGSTGPPKGTVITHRNLQAQTSSLTESWKIDQNDHILHVLPLNHVHGCVNALLCPLTVGAKISMQRHFQPAAVWSTLLNVNQPSKERISVFMAVPTIYSLLIAEYEKTFSKNDRMVEYIRAQCEKKIRLMVSGSAPLPVNVFETWNKICGHKLLERYGMTEIGMALSNPYIVDKSRDRIPGTVGAPLPDTEVKIVKDGKTLCQVKGESGKGLWSNNTPPIYEPTSNKDTPKDTIGELYVRGPSVFVEYYKKPDETKNSFDNGWFRTGDVARYENGIFRILGRMNVDIIKTGGHKVSALDVEAHILDHPKITDACVVGVPDITWGQSIGALVVTDDKAPIDVPELKQWLGEHLAPYQVPTSIKFVDELPRNAMGKVNKREMVRDFFDKPAAAPENKTNA